MSKLFKLIGAFTASVFLLLSITTSVSAEKKILFSIKGPGSGRESAVRSLGVAGLEVISIKDVTPIPHNGCRPSKRRRV